MLLGCSDLNCAVGGATVQGSKPARRITDTRFITKILPNFIDILKIIHNKVQDVAPSMLQDETQKFIVQLIQSHDAFVAHSDNNQSVTRNQLEITEEQNKTTVKMTSPRYSEVSIIFTQGQENSLIKSIEWRIDSSLLRNGTLTIAEDDGGYLPCSIPPPQNQMKISCSLLDQPQFSMQTSSLLKLSLDFKTEEILAEDPVREFLNKLPTLVNAVR